MDGQIGIGVVGTGFGVRVQIPVWAGLPGVRVVSVCSGSEERAHRVRLVAVDVRRAELDDDLSCGQQVAAISATASELVPLLFHLQKEHALHIFWMSRGHDPFVKTNEFLGERA